MSYEGIGADTLYLLAENRFQDRKSFYEEHKAELRARAVEPLRCLVAELAPAMLAIDPLIVVDPMKNGCVSRIRRDNRYTIDKSLYRENLWIAFQRDKRAWDYCLPAFYLDFSVSRAEWGMGFYSAKPEVMRALRRRTDEDPAPMLAALKKAQKAGFALGGRPYARPRSDPALPALLRPLYDCRNLEASRTEPPVFVADTTLPVRLAEGFAALAPLYRQLTDAVEEARGLREV